MPWAFLKANLVALPSIAHFFDFSTPVDRTAPEMPFKSEFRAG